MLHLRALHRQQPPPMNIRYRVTLSDEERTQLQALLNGEKAQVRQVKRGQILLAAEQGTPEHVIAKAVRTSEATIYRTKKDFVERGGDVPIVVEG
jgi:hypothetical protein